LHQKLTEVLVPLGRPYEIIFINDGSTDRSPQILAELFEADPAVRVIHFQRNFGKTAGLTAGFRQSRGDVVITLDADLQDDPAEIPAMLGKLEEGYDLVAAWRYHRQDPIDEHPSAVCGQFLPSADYLARFFGGPKSIFAP
jgi:glycosyltransferase involved in cell wall biosynthesis